MKHTLKNLVFITMALLVSCNNKENQHSYSKDQKLILEQVEKKKISFLEFQKLMECQTENGTNTTNCIECTNPCYNDITLDQFEAWKKNYQDEDIPKLMDGTQAPTAETKSVWVDLDQLENYICTVKRMAIENGYSTDLGLRMYFIKYSNTVGGNNISDANLHKLSIAFVPTYYNANHTGNNKDVEMQGYVNSKSADSSTYIFSIGKSKCEDRIYTNLADRFNPCPDNCPE